MSCIRANVPITIVEGGTFDKTFQWKTGTPSIAVDLTGYTAHMQIRKKLKEENPLLDIDFQDKFWVADGDTGIYLLPVEDEYDDVGKWKIYIKDTDTQGICDSHKDISGVFDMFIYNPSGESVLQIYGIATIVASVTRDDG